MSEQPKLNIFVSSTSEDLRDYRAVARNVILNLGCHPVMMEHFGAGTEPTIVTLRRKLDECDLVLLLSAFRRGAVPTPAQGGTGVDSFTKLELDYARSKSLPVVALLANDTWPGRLWEPEQEAREWVDRFRRDLNQAADFFDYEQVTSREEERFPGFRAKVTRALLTHLQDLQAKKLAIRIGPTTLAPHFFSTARDALVEGEAVPFVGLTLYGTGPLSAGALARALLEKMPPSRWGADPPRPTGEVFPSLATDAEYRERWIRSRDAFLREFGAAIEAQAAVLPLPRLYQLLCQVEPLPLVVSATYDMLLENCFREASRPFVVITHVLRSADRAHDGKILVLREGRESEICVADKVDLRDAGTVIYKPMGSPRLQEELNPDLEIDTVVVTEADHLTFLGRLANQLTQIPPAVVRLLRRRPLLFLGYALDVWQYRLVMQVFQSIGNRGTSSILAVREPDTTFEEIAWDRLSADLIRLEPDDFAARVMAQLQPH